MAQRCRDAALDVPGLQGFEVRSAVPPTEQSHDLSTNPSAGAARLKSRCFRDDSVNRNAVTQSCGSRTAI